MASAMSCRHWWQVATWYVVPVPVWVICALVVAIGRWGGSGSFAGMEVSVGDLRARAGRLRRKYLDDVLGVGFLFVIYGGIAASSHPGDWSLLENYCFVGPGALAWAVTGSTRYGGWACTFWFFAVVLFGWGWLAVWTSVLTIVAFGPLACFVAVRRANGWTCRRAFRTWLARLGEWLQVEVRDVEPVAVGVLDRPNTGSEKAVMAVVWVAVVCLCVWLGHESGVLWAALEAGIVEAVTEAIAEDTR